MQYPCFKYNYHIIIIVKRLRDMHRFKATHDLSLSSNNSLWSCYMNRSNIKYYIKAKMIAKDYVMILALRFETNSYQYHDNLFHITRH